MTTQHHHSPPASFGVCYLLIGSRHAPLLAVSIHTLRDYYAGPVAILVGDDEAEKYARLIAQADGQTQVIRWQFVGGERGSVYAAKLRMFDLSPFDRTVFLDADTIVAGDFSALCPRGNRVRITQFADWVTTGKKMSGRIVEWLDTAPLLVARMLHQPYPAINTGVLSFTKESGAFFRAWSELCHQNIRFICDEISCQLMFPDYPHEVLPDRFNWCPLYSRSPQSEAVVIHFHGGFDKLLKKEQYRKLWLPEFQRAQGFAQLSEWCGEANDALKGVACPA